MSALDDPARVLARLRHAAETAHGRRVLVDRDDLLAALDAAARPPAPLPDLDALTGHSPPPAVPGPVRSAVPTPVMPPPPGRGRRHVALTATVADGKRLARAAWESQPEERVKPHGAWDEADPALTWPTVQAAVRALELLVGEG